MTNTLRKTVAAIALSTMALTPIAIGLNVLSVDAAYANNGKGKGSGNSASNRSTSNQSSSNRGQAKKAERTAIMEESGAQNWGAIASELGELNKAHANPNARANSSDPVHALLATYEGTGGITADGVIAYNTANQAQDDYETYVAAYNLNPDYQTVPVLDANGDPVLDANGDPETVDVAIPAASFDDWAEDNGIDLTEADLASILTQENADAYAGLAALSEGSLTSGAIDALNQMLGLSSPYDG